MNTRVKGLHHITAISGQARQNFQFYTEVLGLKLVKKTVNFDDPGVYHLYYGDETGSPGSLMTFFPYGGPQSTRGSGQVTATSYPVASLEEWREKLHGHKIPFVEESRFGRDYLMFSDPHGMRLEVYQGLETQEPLGRMGGATLSLEQTQPTRELLELLGFEFENSEGNRERFRLPDIADYLDLATDSRRGTNGQGSIHHIALRVKDQGEQEFWRKRLIRAGFSVSPVMDRTYFHSIYFRGPGGVLFELATDPPGMLVDESVEELGKKLKLPPQYEHNRERIERVLEPLEEPYKSISKEGEGATIVALHGTGGDEYDLLNLVDQIAPGHPLLSLRGNVNEQGMARFFRRTRPGVFDQADLLNRTEELAEFLKDKGEHRIAVGYSNGANIAAATLMNRPDTFERAILFRPMLGWTPPVDVNLAGKSVLILVGGRDRIVSPQSGQDLADSLSRLGAEVQVQLVKSDHGLTSKDIEIARLWLEGAQATAA